MADPFDITGGSHTSVSNLNDSADRPSVRPSVQHVLRRRRLTIVDNTGSRASAVNTTLTTAVAARAERTDGRTDGWTVVEL
uniref:Protein of unassigned function n=1 Tax=Haemonchus contortus TaxID=6289 RepID=A0A7I4YDW4_HAECO